MSDTVIRVENLSKRYVLGAKESLPKTRREAISAMVGAPLKYVRSLWGEASQEEAFWALKDVSFEVKAGEVVGIIGRNGAGKSTLLKILSRITKPSSGRAEIRGRVGSLLEVGTGFHPELTGRENIYLNGAILGMRRWEIDKKFDEIVAFAEIDRFLDTPVKRYSSGMYMRLAFAVAAHLEPDILVVDEVLSVGDAEFQKKCLGKMQDVATKDGRTVLFVTHNMETIRHLCHQSILINKGNILFQGEVDTAIRKYTHANSDSDLATFEIIPPNDRAIEGYAYKLTIEDEDGHLAATIPVGKPWQIRIYLKILTRIEGLVVGLGFITDTGIPLRTVWSHPQNLDVGEHQIIFREETIILSPGDYSLTLGLSVHNMTFQYREKAGILQIGEQSEGVKSNIQKISGTGILLNPIKIELVS
jgi:lipopolysaccharide transport system ATP-binding protein